jgi:preprotein translocase subunit SecA
MAEQWDPIGLEKALAAELNLEVPVQKWLDEDAKLEEHGLRRKIVESAHASYSVKETVVGATVLRHFERAIMLQSLDMHWREHLAALDHLRQGIHLRGYAQKNPKQEYKREAFELFSAMLDAIKREVTQITMTVRIQSEEDVEAVEPAPAVSNVQYHHAGYEEVLASGDDAPDAQQQPFVRKGEKVGRNDPCPCGSGKKYKHCHGRLA